MSLRSKCIFNGKRSILVSQLYLSKIDIFETEYLTIIYSNLIKSNLTSNQFTTLKKSNQWETANDAASSLKTDPSQCLQKEHI